MEHNRILAKTVPYLRRTWVVRMIHKYDGVYSATRHQTDIKRFDDCYKEHRDDFQKVYKLLEDEKSKNTYKAVIEFRRTYKYKAIKEYEFNPQYFVDEIFKYDNEVFVDGGAYTGDTIFNMLKDVPIKAIKKIYAWEPDKGNGEILKNEVGKVLKNKEVIVECIPCLMYRDKTILNFSASANGGSHIEQGGDSSVDADTIDNRCADATFIKMDIEGAEIDALYGAKKTIMRNKPKLAISIYHMDEHLYEIPLLIHEWVPEYRLYIRHHSNNKADTVVYATAD
jgi:FkbM family methyltransferase